MSDIDDAISAVTQNPIEQEFLHDLARRKLFGIIVISEGPDCKVLIDKTGEPACYKSVRRAQSMAEKMTEETGEQWVTSLWVHPEYYLLPLNKYKLMKGRFPGSPRK